MEELELRLGSQPLLDQRCVPALVGRVGANLRRLALHRCRLSVQWLLPSTLEAVVRSAPGLEDLELPYQPLTRPLAAELCRLQCLQRLLVSGLSDDFAQPLTPPGPLPPALRMLEMPRSNLGAGEIHCLDLPSCCTRVVFRVFDAGEDSVDTVKSALQKLHGRTKGQSLVVQRLPPPGLAAFAPELGLLQLRGLDLSSAWVTPEEVQAMAVRLATVEDLTLALAIAPADLVPLESMPSLKKLTLWWIDDLRVYDAWADEAAVHEVLLRLLTGPAPLEILVLDVTIKEPPHHINAAIASATARAWEQLSAEGRDPGALQLRTLADWND